jgi:hypothetical protein
MDTFDLAKAKDQLEHLVRLACPVLGASGSV